MDALLAGAGRKDVRAGVMVLLATIKTVVTDDGKTLTLTATDYAGGTARRPDRRRRDRRAAHVRRRRPGARSPARDHRLRDQARDGAMGRRRGGMKPAAVSAGRGVADRPALFRFRVRWQRGHAPSSELPTAKNTSDTGDHRRDPHEASSAMPSPAVRVALQAPTRRFPPITIPTATATQVRMTGA